MDRTVAHLNIEHYRKLLTQDTDEIKRQTILRLVAGGRGRIDLADESAPTKSQSLGLVYPLPPVRR